MKRKLLLAVTAAIMSCTLALGQGRQWEDYNHNGYIKIDTAVKHGYTLIFINKDSLLNPQVENNLKAVFWKVYPQEVKRFNKQALKTITILVSDDYRGVAATANGFVKIDQNWLRNNPEDVDLLTHELMHVVQGYTYNIPDPWLTDGIADYARYVFGVNNQKSNWSLTPFNPAQSYRNTYRIAARFLVWLEQHEHKGLVKQLDKALREKTYSPQLWIKLTGKNVDELWNAYAAAPELKS